MFVLSKVKFLTSSINSVAKSMSTFLSPYQYSGALKQRSGRDTVAASKYLPVSCLHTSSPSLDIMEFFDVKDNWGAKEVKVGRSWRKEELRIKSNSDLHKLWFVLLKERNMLLTMEHEAKEKVVLFPNAERLDKVEESMENLEDVVRERNRAYFQLETGETGERDKIVHKDAFGLVKAHKAREYVLPKFMNTTWRKKYYHDVFRGTAVKKFLRRYYEKRFVEKKRARNRDHNHVLGLLKRFPHIDPKVLEAHYPDVNIKAAMNNKKSRGHHDSNTA